MAHDMEHLKREIESLEKQLAALRFGGLFDRKRVEQLEDKLRKKRKEVTRVVAGDDDDLDADHIDIPEIDASLVPDLEADFGTDIDHDEPAAKSVAKPSKTAAKPAAKPVKKAASKTKPVAKPKPKPKVAAKKKAVAKPAKKKSKR